MRVDRVVPNAISKSNVKHWPPPIILRLALPLSRCDILQYRVLKYGFAALWAVHRQLFLPSGNQPGLSHGSDVRCDHVETGGHVISRFEPGI